MIKNLPDYELNDDESKKPNKTDPSKGFSFEDLGNMLKEGGISGIKGFSISGDSLEDLLNNLSNIASDDNISITSGESLDDLFNTISNFVNSNMNTKNSRELSKEILDSIGAHDSNAVNEEDDDYDDDGDWYTEDIDFNELDSVVSTLFDDFEDYVDPNTEQPVDVDKIINDIRKSGFTKYSELNQLDMSGYNTTEKDFVDFLTDADDQRLIEKMDARSGIYSNFEKNDENLEQLAENITNSGTDSFRNRLADCLLDHNIEDLKEENKMELVQGICECNSDRKNEDMDELTDEQINYLIDAYLKGIDNKYKPADYCKYDSLLCDPFSKEEFIKRFNIPEEIFDIDTSTDIDFDKYNLLNNFDVIPESLRDNYSYCTLVSYMLNDYDNKCAVISLLGKKGNYIMPKTVAIYKDGNDYKYFSLDGDETKKFDSALCFDSLKLAYSGNYDVWYAKALLEFYDEKGEADNISHCFVARKRVRCPLSMIGNLEIIPKYEAKYDRYVYIGDVTIANTEDAKEFVQDYELKPEDGKLQLYAYSKKFSINSRNIIKIRDSILKSYDFNGDIIQNHIDVKIDNLNNFIYIDLDE